jgi:hypothetical protein
VADAAIEEGDDAKQRRERERGVEIQKKSGTAVSYAFSICCNSPDWYISRMMSAPPTNSPLT